VLGGWAWLTSVSLAVIGRPSMDVGLQFGEMSATNVGKCEEAWSRLAVATVVMATD